MRGQFAELAKIIRRTHEAASEKMMPHAIHNHAGNQRIVRPQHRLGQFESAGLFGVKRLRIKRFKKTTRHRLARLLVAAAREERHVARVALHHSRRALRHGHGGFELAIILHKLRRFGGAGQCVGQ